MSSDTTDSSTVKIPNSRGLYLSRRLYFFKQKKLFLSKIAFCKCIEKIRLEKKISRLKKTPKIFPFGNLTFFSTISRTAWSRSPTGSRPTRCGTRPTSSSNWFRYATKKQVTLVWGPKEEVVVVVRIGKQFQKTRVQIPLKTRLFLFLPGNSFRYFNCCRSQINYKP